MFKWTYVEKKLFDGIKRVFDHDTLLVYPYFNKCVDTHTYSSYWQVLAVTVQNGKHIPLYSFKTTGLQMRYIVMEK